MINVTNLTKEILGTPLFDGVSFTLHRGDKVGLIGTNGSGKTTLLQLIRGELEPDQGSIKTEHERIGYVAQATVEATVGTISEFFDQSDKENVLKALEHVGLADVPETQLVQNLSGGQKTKLALAQALLIKPTVLLMDEPTNNLDLDGLSWLEQFIKDFRGSILLVSHDRSLLDSTVTRIFEIDGVNTTFKEYTGGYTDYVICKEKALEKQEREYRRKIIKEERMKLWLTRKRDEAKTYVDPAKGKQIKAMEKRLQREVYDRWVEKPKDTRALKKVQLDGRVHSGKLMLRVDGVSKQYGEKSILRDVSFELRGRERVLLSGANGSGKTTLLKSIIGEVQIDQGEIQTGENVRYGYFAQEHETFDPEKNVLEEFENTERAASANRSSRAILGAFLFSGSSVFKKVKDVSFGERVRLTFAKLMQQENELLILDEPTNHLDIPSREAIERALLEYQGAVLVVSHDRYFLDRIGIDREIRLT